LGYQEKKLFARAGLVYCFWGPCRYSRTSSFHIRCEPASACWGVVGAFPEFCFVTIPVFLIEYYRL